MLSTRDSCLCGCFLRGLAPTLTAASTTHGRGWLLPPEAGVTDAMVGASAGGQASAVRMRMGGVSVVIVAVYARDKHDSLDRRSTGFPEGRLNALVRACMAHQHMWNQGVVCLRMQHATRDVTHRARTRTCPPPKTRRLFTRDELELVICGSPELDFEALEKSAQYQARAPESAYIY